MELQTDKFYAGIGSRDTPKHIRSEMTELAGHLEKLGYCLRSGNARGADQAFALGVEKNAQIWLPFDSFEREFRRDIKPNHDYRFVSGYDVEALTSVDRYHPSPESLMEAGRSFMARNYRQVIGKDEPNSKFVICWTICGKVAGGTGQAIRIAKDFKIPVINMFDFQTADAVIDYLRIWHEL